jgi:hypothetical protein
MRRAAIFALLLAGPAAAADPVAKSESLAAAFLRQPAGAAGFEPVPANGPLSPGELLIGLPGAALKSANSAVVLTSRADPDGTSPLPILETAVVLNPPDKCDLDVTLERGRIDLTNWQLGGAATVRVRFHRQTWTIVLDKPDAKVAVEVVSRWPAGSAFLKTPTPGHEPAAAAVIAVLAGTASVSDGKTTLALSAPPGPAVVEWASDGDGKLTARRLDSLPEWADPAALRPAVQKSRAVAETFRAAVAGGKIGDAIDRFLASADPAEKRVGLIAAGATDDLPRLAAAIAETHDPEVWDFAAAVARHWVGRGPGQDVVLYKFLTTDRKLPPAQAETVLDLLHGFTAAEQKQPETFEVLIEYLRSDWPAVRNLAAWHLARLAPAGKSIPFRPNGSKAEFEAGYKQWKALVPAGKLPPAGK